MINILDSTYAALAKRIENNCGGNSYITVEEENYTFELFCKVIWTSIFHETRENPSEHRLSFSVMHWKCIDKRGECTTDFNIQRLRSCVQEIW